MLGHLTSGAPRHKADDPQPTTRIFDKNRVAKRIRLCRDYRFKDLLAGTIDRPHDRHAVENCLTKLDDPAAEESGCDRANGGDQDQADDQARAGDIGENKLIEPRQDARHLPVDQFDGRPGDIDRQQNRCGDQKAGQEPCAQASQHPGAFYRCLSGCVGHGNFLSRA